MIYKHALETEFKLALVKLLNCRNLNAAYAVINERRRFEDLVASVKELFEIYNTDTDSRRQLSEIIATAKLENPVANFLYALEAYDLWKAGKFDKPKKLSDQKVPPWESLP